MDHESATGTSPRSAPACATPDDSAVVLRAEGIDKHFGGITALSSASIDVAEAEVMGLVGDNGAGKSTLIKILAGSLVADEGQVYLRGERVRFHSPAEALAAGIETVYQDLALVDSLSALANLYLGREMLRPSAPGRMLRLLNNGAMRRQAEDVFDQLGAKIPSINQPARDLSGGQRQALAIGRALLFGRRVVILDEPTASLGVRESAHVVEMIKKLRSQGCSVLVVSHNVGQLLSFADRVTVLRLGRTVGMRKVADTTPAEIVSLITGAASSAYEYNNVGADGRS